MSGKWKGSTRRSRLPRGWQRIRSAVLARDRHQCRAPVEGGKPCGREATDVDHIDRNGPDIDWNLQSLCGWHHRQKSASEGGNAKPRRSKKRKPEKHPGMIDNG